MLVNPFTECIEIRCTGIVGDIVEGSDGELPCPTALGATRPSLVEERASCFCVGIYTDVAQGFQTPQATSLYGRFGVSHSYRMDTRSQPTVRASCRA